MSRTEFLTFKLRGKIKKCSITSARIEFLKNKNMLLCMKGIVSYDIKNLKILNMKWSSSDS